MYTASINNKKFQIEIKDKQIHLNNEAQALDIVNLDSKHLHVLDCNKSYNIELVELNREEKTVKIKVNKGTYTVHLQDEMDLLLKSMGLDAATSQKVADLKAPMPGLVIDIRVEEGQEIKKGDPLVVLEAMKMENILKAAADGVVKKISIKKGQAVEKNTVLVQF